MTDRRTELQANLGTVHERIATACADAGRDPAELTLVAVTKFFPAADVVHLADLGVRHVGENKDQEAGAKVAELPAEVRELLTVHFVGQLQSNKAGHVARYADVVQSVDRPKIVKSLDRGAGAALAEGARHTPLEVTIQVDLGEGADAGRGGAVPADVPALADAVAAAEHLRLRGVMAVAPLGLDEDGTAAAFQRLADLSARLRADHPEATWVSAGMSGDLETAVTHGATHLRVGTGILGARR
ncbi:YggS family pyridoxal phosphate-dependent enzyme [Ornithinimicrobium kibberense]|uniref:Pyridoxal phosphate homeostasis protein n=1 Tax=Ornithinimicrobium kibberense TaxID=282060 RepID=A0ABV5V312_9MICO|nr:YggS family pyridoxal phosphate-dependent enzyme [Ornithinimicrobium kibberense]